MIDIENHQEEYEEALRKSREQEATRPISESATLMSKILFLKNHPAHQRR